MIERAQTPDARATLVAYMASKMGSTPEALVGQMPFEVVAVKRGGKVVAAVLYLNYRTTSIEIAAAGEKGWATRGNLRQIFTYPFKQLGVHTVLALVVRRNKVSREFIRKLGFVEMCAIPCGIKDNDTMVNAMTRDQCLWITPEAQQRKAA